MSKAKETRRIPKRGEQALRKQGRAMKHLSREVGKENFDGRIRQVGRSFGIDKPSMKMLYGKLEFCVDFKEFTWKLLRSPGEEQ